MPTEKWDAKEHTKKGTTWN